MKFNTAMTLLLLSSSALARGRLAGGGMIAAVLIAVLTLAEYALRVDLGIDELVYQDVEGHGKLYPQGRLAPVTAIITLCFGAAYGAICMSRRPAYRVGQIFLLLACRARRSLAAGWSTGRGHLRTNKIPLRFGRDCGLLPRG